MSTRFAFGRARRWLCAVAMSIALAAPAGAQETVTFADLDALVRQKPLQPGGPTADIVASKHVGASDLQVVVARKIDLHTHEDSEHTIYVARGSGLFHFAGQTRPVAAGDMLTVPIGVVHGFEASAGQELVLLVVETPR
jgi:quercetin dioxygenase-like cupin family protein